MATEIIQGASVAVVSTNGIPVVNVATGTPMIVTDSGKGTPVVIVSANGIPVHLMNEDGSDYS